MFERHQSGKGVHCHFSCSLDATPLNSLSQLEGGMGNASTYCEQATGEHEAVGALWFIPLCLGSALQQRTSTHMIPAARAA